MGLCRANGYYNECARIGGATGEAREVIGEEDDQTRE